ncbi:MAG: restriction endonuclease [Chloroflexi bacterium]|nr:restriction endonuclease [Chloroflexota bacterium]
MRILLIQDVNLNLDLTRCANILNELCKANIFLVYEEPLVLKPQSTDIDYPKEEEHLRSKLVDIKADHIFYITKRKYRNNYFFYSNYVTILSLFGWNYYTQLPIENGLFYFVAMILSLQVDSSFRHEASTGCIYDFLGEKTAVDIGMKTGALCKECRARIERSTEQDQEGQRIISDVNSILNALAKLSKLGKSMYKFNRKANIFDWSSFEDEVARIYREQGAKVKQNITFAGFQVDILIQEAGQNSKDVSFKLVECKYSQGPVNRSSLLSIQRMVETLKKDQLVKGGIVVSKSGFTQSARFLAKKLDLELVNFGDLRLSNNKMKPREGIAEPQDRTNHPPPTLSFMQKTGHDGGKSRNIFVLIPFTKDMEDVFFLGIRETAEQMSCSCDKVDTKKFVGPILSKIYDSIRDARIVVAEVSKVNANVYYELGYAHALDKPTILITKNVRTSPFDTKGFNHIIYVNLVDLRKQLKETLEAVLVD